MATEVLLIKYKGRLASADPISAETIDGMRNGEVISATLRRSRNPGHHRKFFALIGEVYKNQTRYATVRQLLNRVKIETGYYEIETLSGKIPVQVMIPQSISFASMDQNDFEQFYNKAVEFILFDLLPGVAKEDLEQRVLEIIEGER